MSTPPARLAHLFLAAVGGGVVALSLSATTDRLVPRAAAADAEVVRAQRFEVVDSAGRLRARLGTKEDGSPSLILLDANGKGRALFAVSSDGSSLLTLNDATMAPMLSLSTRADMPSVSLAVAGQTKAMLAVKATGAPSMTLHGSNGSTVMGETADGPSVSLNDATGNAIAMLLVKHDGSPSLTLLSGAGALKTIAP